MAAVQFATCRNLYPCPVAGVKWHLPLAADRLYVNIRMLSETFAVLSLASVGSPPVEAVPNPRVPIAHCRRTGCCLPQQSRDYDEAIGSFTKRHPLSSGRSAFIGEVEAFRAKPCRCQDETNDRLSTLTEPELRALMSLALHCRTLDDIRISRRSAFTLSTVLEIWVMWDSTLERKYLVFL